MSLPEAVDVEPERSGALRRLILSLVGVGVLIGLLATLGSLVFGTVAQTEVGLCRLTVAPCTELSLGSVEQLSGLDLPDGTEVVSGYAQELSTLSEFRAEVVLPEGARVTMSASFEQASDQLMDLPDAARDLRGTTLWSRSISDGEGYSYAIVGTRDGRTVIVFDEQSAPLP